MGARKAGSSTLVTAWSLGAGSAPRARSTGDAIKMAARAAGFHSSNGFLMERDCQDEPKAWLLWCFQIVCNPRCHFWPSLEHREGEAAVVDVKRFAMVFCL